MSRPTRSLTVRVLTAETGSANGIAGRPMQAYWFVLAPYFRDILLPPQRRVEDAVIVWAWEEPLDAAPLAPADLAAVRERLQRGTDLLTDASETSDSGEPHRQALLRLLSERLQRVAQRLAELPDVALSGYVARTVEGVRLHSWGFLAPGQPTVASETREGSADRFTPSEPSLHPTRRLRRKRWVALTLALVTLVGLWIFPAFPTHDGPASAAEEPLSPPTVVDQGLASKEDALQPETPSTNSENSQPTIGLLRRKTAMNTAERAEPDRGSATVVADEPETFLSREPLPGRVQPHGGLAIVSAATPTSAATPASGTTSSIAGHAPAQTTASAVDGLGREEVRPAARESGEMTPTAVDEQALGGGGAPLPSAAAVPPNEACLPPRSPASSATDPNRATLRGAPAGHPDPTTAESAAHSETDAHRGEGSSDEATSDDAATPLDREEHARLTQNSRDSTRDHLPGPPAEPEPVSTARADPSAAGSDHLGDDLADSERTPATSAADAVQDLSSPAHVTTPAADRATVCLIELGPWERQVAKDPILPTLPTPIGEAPPALDQLRIAAQQAHFDAESTPPERALVLVLHDRAGGEFISIRLNQLRVNASTPISFSTRDRPNTVVITRRQSDLFEVSSSALAGLVVLILPADAARPNAALRPPSTGNVSVERLTLDDPSTGIRWSRLVRMTRR